MAYQGPRQLGPLQQVNLQRRTKVAAAVQVGNRSGNHSLGLGRCKPQFPQYPLLHYTNELARRPTSYQHQILSMIYLAMSMYINKQTLSSPSFYGPPTLNYPTYIQQRYSSTILAMANKERNIVANTKLAQSWSDCQETTLFKMLRLDVFKYSAVIQTTRWPRVELNFSHSTFPRVKRSGINNSGQAYDYCTL